MTMTRIYRLILLAAFVLLSPGCGGKHGVPNGTPYAVVLNYGSKDNIVIIDENLTILNKLSIGLYLEDIQVCDNIVYAIDSGRAENPRKDLYKINLKDFSVSKLELPLSPHRMLVFNNKAYISSSTEKRGEGFYLMIVDVTNLSLLNTKMIPGMTACLTSADGYVYAAINRGGNHNYGDTAQLLQIDPDSFAMKNVLQDPEELPPGNLQVVGDKFYGVYSGFSRGPKPRWVKQPSEYTNRLKILDFKSGKIVEQHDLSPDFPQNIAVKNNKTAFINHYTNLDMSGDTVTIFDLDSREVIGRINTPTPSDVAVDNKYLLVTNHNEDNLTVFDSNNWKKIKEIPVGKWPTKVKLVNANVQ